MSEPKGIETAELYPCPFCGGKCDVVSNTTQTEWAAECADCSCYQSGDTRVEVVDRWNRRAGNTLPPKHGADGDRVRELFLILRTADDIELTFEQRLLSIKAAATRALTPSSADRPIGEK